ncbi:MAG: polymorphic toxin-type HINT domain-containing protein [Thermoguttaceae bacterium]
MKRNRRILAGGLAVAVLVVLGAASWSAWAAERDTTSRLPKSSAALGQRALECELAGRDVERAACLREALTATPDDPAVHWQLGEVRRQDKWVSPADAAKAAENDPRLAEYRRRRDAAGPNVADQTALALWCRKNRLDDQQRVHWIAVLQLQPNNSDAIRGLGLFAARGHMVTASQVAELTSQRRAVAKAMDMWRPLVTQWRRAVEQHEAAVPESVRKKIAGIATPSEMVSLEAAIWRQVGAKRQNRVYREMLLAMMPALGDNPQPAAAESLARYAAFASTEDVREAAIEGLKRHSLEHYVPLLLSGLRSPIEAAMQCTLTADGDLVTSYSVFQEGALANVSASLMIAPTCTPLDSVNLVVTPGTGTVAGATNDPGRMADAFARARADAAQLPAQTANAKAANDLSAAANYQWNVQNSRRQAVQNAAALQQAVERTNATIAQQNAAIIKALAGATGKKVGDQPMDWWTWWWQDYNDMYNVSGETQDGKPYKPEYGCHERIEYAGSVPAYSSIRNVGEGAVTFVPPHSCFAPGTKVWTLVGLRPIETIKAGDSVLAQDADRGELAYKPVLAVTVREPGSRVRVGLAGETIIATPSHPFWVAGKGWRMTKQLEIGDRIRTTSGSVPIESVEELEADPTNQTSAHNLIVADFASYFVGERGFLVHDNSPRRPTASLLPGLAARAAGE